MSQKVFVLFFLLLISISFSLYPEPPLSNVSAHNFALASGLNHTYDPQYAVNGTINMTFNGTDYNWVPISRTFELPLISASSRMVSIEPSIDNATNIAHEPKLIFSWGYVAIPLESKDWEKLPGLNGDDCVELQNASSVSRMANVTFIFRNTSVLVNTTTNIVPIPENITKLVMETSGGEKLTVVMNCTFDFLYTIDDKVPAVDGCYHRLKNYSARLTTNESHDFIVEGNNTLFFLSEPILREQWYHNNHFKTIVFTNSRVHKANISEDGSVVRQVQLYDFDVIAGLYGTQKVISIPKIGVEGVGIHKIKQDEFGSPSSIAPFPLEQANSTFAYIYVFNHTYSGIGNHILGLSVLGFFNDTKNYSENISSRSLSYSGNLSEAGATYNASSSRPSASFETDALNTVTLGLGLVGVFLILVFMKLVYKY